MGDNFTVLKNTYPEHPLSSQPRNYINRSELLQRRKDQNISDMELQKKLWDQHNPTHIELNQLIPSEFYRSNPAFNSIKAKRSLEREEARIKVGLTANFIDIKDYSVSPTLAFVEEPSIVSRT